MKNLKVILEKNDLNIIINALIDSGIDVSDSELVDVLISLEKGFDVVMLNGINEDVNNEDEKVLKSSINNKYWCIDIWRT